MKNKKYYSISEVTKILNTTPYQLRYLEQILPQFIIRKIKNRRYYTNYDINYLKNYLTKEINIKVIDKVKSKDNYQSTYKKIDRINNLIRKFNKLSDNINILLFKFNS